MGAVAPPKRPAAGVYLRGRIYWLAHGPRHDRRLLSLKTSDPLEAVARASEIRLRQQAIAPSGRGASLLAKYLDEKARRGEFTRKSVEWYRNHLRAFFSTAGDREPPDYSTDAIQRWHDAMPVAASTAGGALEAVRSFFTWAERKGMVARNPCDGIRKRKVVRPARVIFCDRKLRDRLIARAPDDDIRLVLFAGFHAGLRYGEIVELRPEHFDVRRAILHLHPTETFTPKDKEARAIPLTAPFRDFLRQRGLGGGPFVLRPDVPHGRALWRWDCRRAWREFMAEQHCPWVTFHVMRHTFASLLLQAGVSVYKVATWLGDNVDVVQKHYGHLSPSDRDIDALA